MGARRAGLLPLAVCGSAWAQSRAHCAKQPGICHTRHATDGGHTRANWRHHFATLAPLLCR